MRGSTLGVKNASAHQHQSAQHPHHFRAFAASGDIAYLRWHQRLKNHMLLANIGNAVTRHKHDAALEAGGGARLLNNIARTAKAWRMATVRS